MTVATSTAHIVPDTVRRRTGRRAHDEIEEATPTGRAIHRFEDAVWTINGRSVAYREGTTLRLLHDAEHDRNLEAAGRIVEACPSCRHTAGPLIRAAQAADEREDAVALHGDGLVAAIHSVGRRVAGWLERAAVALRGQTGGQ